MIFRSATVSDLPFMMEIIHQAQESLNRLGIDQWQNGYPAPEIILQDIKNKHAYVLLDNDRIIAMQTVIFNHEPTYEQIYEGEWLSKGHFVVIHRMAVDEGVKKSGIASYLLKKVEDMATEKDIRSIKVDTHEGNIPMRKTLEKNGFIYCGRIFFTGRETPGCV